MQVNEVVYYTARILTKEIEDKIKTDLIKRMSADGFKSISPINISSELGGFRVMGEFRVVEKEKDLIKTETTVEIKAGGHDGGSKR